MSLTLCVLLRAHEGRETALVEYEDRVLQLLAERDATPSLKQSV